MKNTALFLVGALFLTLNCQAYDTATAAMRSNGLLRFIAKSESMRDFGLFTVMYTRCKRYVAKSQVDACQDSVEKLIKTLDYDLLFNNKREAILVNDFDPESFVFVAFKSKLIQLLNDAKTTAYLTMINDKLTRFMTGQDSEPANLYNASLEFYGNEKLAVTALAALFQDTSMNRLHIAWLEKSQTRASVQFVENKDLLSRIIQTINFIMDTSEANYRVMFYPPKIQKFINRNIYHFYVPYYAALTMKSSMRAEDAVKGPLMLTLSYEFITSAADMRYLFDDPEQISAQSTLDIYGGYAGGRMGAGMNFIDLGTMDAAFKASTIKGVKSLLP